MRASAVYGRAARSGVRQSLQLLRRRRCCCCFTSPARTRQVKGDTNGFTLKGGDATTGGLKLMFNGPRPAGGYQPMSELLFFVVCGCLPLIEFLVCVFYQVFYRRLRLPAHERVACLRVVCGVLSAATSP